MNTKNTLWIALAALTALLAGCASGARSTAMVPQIPALVHQNTDSVSVSVIGGKKTDPLWASQVSNEDFQNALTQAITNSKLFSTVLPMGSGKYVLEIRLLKLKQPLLGFDMMVVATTDWALYSGAPNSNAIWSDTISRDYTATVGDALMGVERLRLANEGAIRETIKAGLQELSQIALE